MFHEQVYGNVKTPDTYQNSEPRLVKDFSLLYLSLVFLRALCSQTNKFYKVVQGGGSVFIYEGCQDSPLLYAPSPARRKWCNLPIVTLYYF